MSDLISRQAVIEAIETDCSWDMFNEWGSLTPTGESIIEAIKRVPSVEPEIEKCGDCISRGAAEGKLKRVVDEMALIFSDIRKKNVDDSVCCLCEYDCDHGIDGYANECPGFERDDCFKLKEEYRKEWMDLSDIPSVEPERKTGEWQEVYTETDYQYGWIEFTCENCGYQHGLESGEYDWHFGEPIPWKYCPMCGAKMEVDG